MDITVILSRCHILSRTVSFELVGIFLVHTAVICPVQPEGLTLDLLLNLPDPVTMPDTSISCVVSLLTIGGCSWGRRMVVWRLRIVVWIAHILKSYEIPDWVWHWHWYRYS